MTSRASTKVQTTVARDAHAIRARMSRMSESTIKTMPHARCGFRLVALATLAELMPKMPIPARYTWNRTPSTKKAAR